MTTSFPDTQAAAAHRLQGAETAIYAALAAALAAAAMAAVRRWQA